MSYHGGGRYQYGGDDRGGREYPDRGRDRERGEYRGTYDRSRSRDEGPRQHDRGGGGGYDRGGRGGRGGGRDGGRGGRARYTGVRPNMAYPVKTNMFVLTPSAAITDDVFQYYVEILQAKKVFVTSEDNTRHFSHPEIIPGRDKVDAGRAGELARGILKKLAHDENLAFAYDGNSLVNSVGPLFTVDPDALAEKQGGHAVVKAGVYGPEDPGGHNVPAPKKTSIFKDFFVSFKKNSDNEEKDRWISGSFFCVRLTFLCSLSVAKNLALLKNGSSNEKLEGLKDIQVLNQMFDVFLKHQLFTSLRAPGKNPNRFFFEADKQENILGSALQRVFQNDRKTYAPFVGLTQQIRFGEDGNVYFEANECVNYFNREYFYKSPHSPGPARRVPLVNSHENKIAGVSVGNLNAPITDERFRKEIEQALKSLTFHLEYVKDPTKKWLEEQRSLNKSDYEIQKMLTRVRKNLKIKPDVTRGKASVLWAADDPEVYCVEKKPDQSGRDPMDEKKLEEEKPIVLSIAQYFDVKYGIKLRYPKLPIVHIGDKNWYPIEFLYQAFERTKDANSPTHVSDLLKHFDDNAGNKYVDEISSLLKQIEFNDTNFEKIGLVRSCEPVQLSAKILDQPHLKFGNQDASVNNGDWNLRGVQFAKPSELLSFAVIDFSSTGRAKDYLSVLFKVMQSHGMPLPCNVNLTRALDRVYFTQRESREPCFPDTPGGAFTAFKQSLEKAKNFFWYDTSREFRSNYVWFKTRCTSPAGAVSECLLLPEFVNQDNEIGVMLPANVFGPTHKVVTKDKELVVRLMVVVGALDSRNEFSVDPFDFFFENDGHFALQNGSRRRVKFVKYIYFDEVGNRYELSSVKTIGPVILADLSWQITPISMMFVYLEDNCKKTYSMVKMMSQFQFGIPSQCCVHGKYSATRSKEQYCSNIALKCNTKLMNVHNQGRVWNTVHNGRNGLAWISEVPTMVIGVDLSHGIFQESVSVVGASVCLDEGCMQLAQTMRVTSKSQTIPYEIMYDVTKTLFIHFFHHRRVKPQRILFYRAGVSEGDFDVVLSREVAAIRKCFYDIRKETEPGFSSPDGGSDGSIYCTPVMTVVVCQTQHNIKIVPVDDHGGNNVPSGTLVDKNIIDYRNTLKKATRDVPRADLGLQDRVLVPDVIDDGFDFFMTSQGGLKGTSKPIYYRVILNENAVWKPHADATPLSREILQLITYHMAFQYGTATKAVRSLPVLKYSSRLAEMGLGYFSTLRNDAEPKVISMPLDGGKKENQRKLRDGTIVTGEKFIRAEFAEFVKEADNPNVPLPPMDVMTEIISHFSPYEVKLQVMEGLDGAIPHTRSCAFPHLSA